jgi:hypothetical protein
VRKQTAPDRRRSIPFVIALCAASAGALAACGGGDDSPPSSSAAGTEAPAGDTTPGNSLGLPEIGELRGNLSDRLPLDAIIIRSGHPFKGKNAATPHQGAHINVSNDAGEWPRGGTAPSNYPPIYAVADGVVSRVTPTLGAGENDRYGINLAIAASGTAIIDFEYSIEPMVSEPSPGFYQSFINVKEGDRVKKGDVIGYLYLPPGDTGAHIHFSLINTATGEFMAPAIFTKETVAIFYGSWRDQGFDSASGYTVPIAPCMGWKIDASENPYANEAVECLSYPNPSGA